MTYSGSTDTQAVDAALSSSPDMALTNIIQPAAKGVTLKLPPVVLMLLAEAFMRWHPKSEHRSHRPVYLATGVTHAGRRYLASESTLWIESGKGESVETHVIVLTVEHGIYKGGGGPVDQYAFPTTGEVAEMALSVNAIRIRKRRGGK